MNQIYEIYLTSLEEQVLRHQSQGKNNLSTRKHSQFPTLIFQVNW